MTQKILTMINAFFKKLMSSPPLLLLLPQIKELEAPRVPWAGRLKTYLMFKLSCIFKETVYVEHNREKDYSNYRELASFAKSYVMRVTH